MVAAMESPPFGTLSSGRYDIANEVLASAVRILRAAGFSEEEIPRLFEQVASRGVRAPVWLDPL